MYLFQAYNLMQLQKKNTQSSFYSLYMLVSFW